MCRASIAGCAVLVSSACSAPPQGVVDASGQPPLVDGAPLLDGERSFVDASGASDALSLPDGPAPIVHDPVIFVHGINGNDANFDTMRARLVARPW